MFIKINIWILLMKLLYSQWNYKTHNTSWHGKRWHLSNALKNVMTFDNDKWFWIVLTQSFTILLTHYQDYMYSYVSKTIN